MADVSTARPVEACSAGFSGDCIRRRSFFEAHRDRAFREKRLQRNLEAEWTLDVVSWDRLAEIQNEPQTKRTKAFRGGLGLAPRQNTSVDVRITNARARHRAARLLRFFAKLSMASLSRRIRGSWESRSPTFRTTENCAQSGSKIPCWEYRLVQIQ